MSDIMSPIAVKNVRNLEELEHKYREAYNRSDHLTLNRLEGQMVEFAQKSYGKDKEVDKRLTVLEKVARSGNRQELMKLLPTIKKSKAKVGDDVFSFGQWWKISAGPQERNGKVYYDIMGPAGLPYEVAEENIDQVGHTDKISENKKEHPTQEEDEDYPEHERQDLGKDEGSMVSSTPGVYNALHGGRRPEKIPKPNIKITPVKKNGEGYGPSEDYIHVDYAVEEVVANWPESTLEQLLAKYGAETIQKWIDEYTKTGTVAAKEEIEPAFAQAVHDPVRARIGRGRGPMHALTPPRVQRKEEEPEQETEEVEETVEGYIAKLREIVKDFRKLVLSQPDKVTLATYNQYISLATNEDEKAKERLTPKQYIEFGKQYSGTLQTIRNMFDKHVVRRQPAGAEPEEKESRGRLF